MAFYDFVCEQSLGTVLSTVKENTFEIFVLWLLHVCFCLG